MRTENWDEKSKIEKGETSKLEFSKHFPIQQLIFSSITLPHNYYPPTTMSLRPKKINFDTTFTEFRSGLDQIYALQSQDKLSGIRLHELVYDMCVAVPKPFVEPLFNAVALYLTELAGKICEVWWL